jgi:outer membrane protein OmpA-like peptidoglycan-associated protein/tetratricopeptide (TPR) repeat protein
MKKLLIVLFISVSGIALGQDLPFSGTKDKKADYYFGEALKTFQTQDFQRASQWIDKAVALDPNFIDAWMLKAEMKSMDDNFKEAIAIYEKVKSINPEFPMSYYGASKAYYAQGRYEEAYNAAEKFLTYPDFYKKKDGITKIKNNAAFGKEAIQSPVPFNPINLGNKINSADNEYFPGIPADDQTLIFTRLINGRNEDFYISTKQGESYSLAKNMGFPINTDGNEGTISLSADGQYIFYTACNREGGYGSCDLYLSKLDGLFWSEPINLGPPINTRAWESQPCLSYDGKTIYFSSNRPGGYGQSDIWYTTYKEGRWTPPINLGPEINTTADEQSPHIAKDDQTLYFNSSGHPGMGGVDLYLSRRASNGKWSKAQNLGYPINSIKDETCLVIASNGVDAYIARDGEDSRGGLDIYKFQLYEEARPQKTGYVKGVVFDAITKKKIAARIELIDLATGKVVVESYSNKVTGEFLVCLQAHKNYALNIDQKGYLFYSENFEVNTESALAPLQLEVPLQPILAGSKVVLKNIFFDVDKFELKPESKSELDKLKQFLELNSNVKIEVGGHTDNTGDANKNIVLSGNRAKAVKDYLVANGININRVSSKGYAATQPLADNKSPEGRAQNRRTEVKLISVQ